MPLHGRQHGGALEVPGQLDAGVGRVDVLTAGAGRAREAPAQLAATGSSPPPSTGTSSLATLPVCPPATLPHLLGAPRPVPHQHGPACPAGPAGGDGASRGGCRLRVTVGWRARRAAGPAGPAVADGAAGSCTRLAGGVGVCGGSDVVDPSRHRHRDPPAAQPGRAGEAGRRASTCSVVAACTLGVGVGYLEPEFRAIGANFAERGAVTDEYPRRPRAPLVRRASRVPRPLRRVRRRRRPPPPRPAAGPDRHRRATRTAAYRRAVRRGHGWYGYALTPEQTAACLAGLRAAADESRRPADLGRLEISVTPRGRLTAERAEAFAQLGVDRLVVSPRSPADSADETITGAAGGRGEARLIGFCGELVALSATNCRQNR